ncbi:hypothetical protein DEJ46_34685 [Streptomyces venezuelae]|uniref:PARP-type domain-containing protein n=1 Tax=Streptomyces venezuelae TaxID=54571 RepID=A0A5P2B5K7_STRVZ|nr:hypothetical protein DEJ46_34685 [Streptomyces venezuelae]
MAGSETRVPEYSTYVPSGHTCTRCKQGIKQLEPARRIRIIGRVEGTGPLVEYEHLRCPNL